ncbi:MAG TPA: hypothetical protein VK675_03705 [Candidatus Paceibacterota bacterium]|nr:hypothetical protein [Candidatus Paceibacterota bacterium]
MGIEEYKLNQKITKEGKVLPSRIPLKIERGKKHAEGGESDVWEIHTKSGEGANADHIVLKISKDETFATEEEMRKAEEFYRSLKNFPGFGKFVPDTIYFKAQETEDAVPKAFCIQQFIKGERIDRLKDSEIYKDPVAVRQLLELVNVSIEVIHDARKNDTQYPDFMRTPEFNVDMRVMAGGAALIPRYSSNILIADEPDKNGQKVWFVDSGVNANARRKKGWEWNRRKEVNSIIEFQFDRWKKKLEKILANSK